ncbi:glutamate formimidoyltransferase [candidate division KSB3 bacterium]|uniref:Formimidoyltransferase-cyclodeaminase n=1 Tax=candidate division KSB3 bacterium TaxID=2044937 RepID=A0A2G6K8X1_9BACT|nr:MAG: glutamate formimidoyltransferase [candidate division KSB3 bacterium]
MKKIVECVPNFSEGRRPEVIEAIVEEVQTSSDVFLLGKEMDADHNRAVITLAGEPEAVKGTVFRMIKKASELIDLTNHTGEHPRMGATDVVPFIPIENVTVEECIRLAQELGQRVGDELQIPVFLYEDAATRPERKNLAKVRKGQFEGLRDQIGVNPKKEPDYGPDHIHPTAGATAIGARFFLIAYNVNLDSQDLALAKAIGKNIRESSGGFPSVKAMGFELKEKNCVQVSMNMTNYTVTSLSTVFSAIQQQAAEAGVSVSESELIGFVPRDALTDTAAKFLKLTDFNSSQILENSIAQKMTEAPQEKTDLREKVEQLSPFLKALDSDDPTPGGGSAAALSGALAGALAGMLCNVTVGKKKYQDVAEELSVIRNRAQEIRLRLQELIVEDSQAFDAVMAAFKLPKTTDEEKNLRSTAIQNAFKRATESPLDIMQNALEILKVTATLVEKGNPNAMTDLACAVHMANAAIAGAALNVKINLNSIKDAEFATQIENDVLRIQQEARDMTTTVLGQVEAKLR